MSTQNLRAKD